MNETVLNALIHLFGLLAIVSRRIDSESGRSIVLTFLKRYLTSELLIEYLKVYDNYIDFYRREVVQNPRGKNKDQQSLVTFQVTNVCQQIKKGLLRDERLVVFLYLLEFVNEDKQVSREEEAFVKTVSDVFNIGESEFRNIYSFIIEPDLKNIEPEKLLFIDNRVTEWSDDIAWFMKKTGKKTGKPESKHIFVENLYGQISILYITSINSYIFRYNGAQNLYLESQRILPGQFYFLKRGAIIRGPNIRPVYYSGISARFLEDILKTPVKLQADQISFRFSNSDNGIHTFSFELRSGEIAGIMGGSGVGKSTLLNILNGKLPPHEGRILINGYDVYRNRKSLEGVIGYVPQDDMLIEELTVYQNLYYNARLCFRDYTEKEIDEKVREVLHDLDLYDIRNLKVGNPLKKFISGGQRKRLNIGLELMREPSVLFADEPTSGLSSMDSDKVMALLKRQAQKGKVIIVNIHQPSADIFKLFDRLIVLDRGGYPVYTGNPVDALVYFKKINLQVDAAISECPLCGNIKPEQILQIIEAKTVDDFGMETAERKVSPEEWYRHYQENIAGKQTPKIQVDPLPENPLAIPRLWQQFLVFFRRNLLAKLTDRQYLLISFLEAPLLAFILAYLTRYIGGENYFFGENRNIPVFFFMSVIVALFIGLTVSAEEIIRDRKILERESFLNLSRFSYLNAKIVYLFGVSAIQTLSFVIPAHLILDIQGMTFSFWLILFTTSCLANLLGLNISSAFDSVITIYIFIPLIMVPQILLGGAMIHFDDLHPSITNRKYVPFIGDLMTTRWAYEAMTVQQFKKNRFNVHFYEADQQISESDFSNAFLLPRLENMVREIMWYRELDGSDQELIAVDLRLLRTELIKLGQRPGQTTFGQLTYIEPGLFDDKLAEDIMAYLYLARLDYQNLNREANQHRNAIYDSLVGVYGREGFDTFRLEHHNSSLSDMLRNTRRTEKIEETPRGFVQKMDPVYMMPVSDFGRAHFYAPFKMINGRLIDTLLFNLVFIWFTSALLYLALYLDTLRKLTALFHRRKH